MSYRYTIHHGSDIFDVRTRSPRRYLVVDVRLRAIAYRTNSLTRAGKAADRGGPRYIVFDTYERVNL